MKNLTLKQLLGLVAVCGLSLGGLEAKKQTGSKSRDAHHGAAKNDDHHGVASEQAQGSRAGTRARSASLEAGRGGKSKGPALTKPSGSKKIGKNKAHGKKLSAKQRARRRTRRVARRGSAVGKKAVGKGGLRPESGNAKNIGNTHRGEEVETNSYVENQEPTDN